MSIKTSSQLIIITLEAVLYRQNGDAVRAESVGITEVTVMTVKHSLECNNVVTQQSPIKIKYISKMYQ